MKNKKILFMTQAGAVAALYALLTYISAVFNLAYGPFQFRISEVMTVLPAFTSAAIPGLTIGCLIANIGSSLGIIDMIFGTAATLFAAIATWMLRKITISDVPVLASLPPIIFNSLFVGLEIACISNTGFSFQNITWTAFLSAAFSVGIGELVICYGLGLPMMIALKKTNLSNILFERKKSI
jgi:uncharacterized membrane protein